ncbi:MAG TPA: glycosyltransferase family 1 protein [Acetobacteraceae bacterium]|nr:glycosyltransferase family 1 protein [Acetobacteraceae bacterium]
MRAEYRHALGTMAELAVGQGRVAARTRQPVPIYINGRFLQQPITGVQRYARELLTTWDRMLVSGEISGQGTEFRVLAPRGPIDVPKLERIRVGQVGRLGGHLWTQLELPFFARDGLLFSPGNIHPLLPLARMGSVVTVHDLAYAAYPEAYSKAFRLLYSLLVPAALRRADAVITVSDAEKTHILGRHPAANGRIHAVHLGAPQGCPAGDGPSVPENTLANRPFVLWVGTLIARKNPQGVIDAVARVNQDTPLDLIVAGASQPGLLKGGLSLPPELQGRVHFHGQINDIAELRRLYESATALVFPSFYESFGLPPLEAMRFGCPVIASDIPALREICGDAALYADPHQPADIARRIRRLLNDPALRAELSERGSRRAVLFSWERCARETFTILSRVLERDDRRWHRRRSESRAMKQRPRAG